MMKILPDYLMWGFSGLSDLWVYILQRLPESSLPNFVRLLWLGAGVAFRSRQWVSATISHRGLHHLHRSEMICGRDPLVCRSYHPAGYPLFRINLIANWLEQPGTLIATPSSRGLGLYRSSVLREMAGPCQSII